MNLDFSHLRPAPEASSATSTSTPFAERMLTADAATRGEVFDRAKLVAAPPQRRTIATASEIMAAHRAAHPSRYAGS